MNKRKKTSIGTISRNFKKNSISTKVYYYLIIIYNIIIFFIEDLLQNIDLNMQVIANQNFRKEYKPKQISKIEFMPDRGYYEYSKIGPNNVCTG